VILSDGEAGYFSPGLQRGSVGRTVARKLKRDRVLFVTTMALLAVSIVMVYSASAVIAQERYQQGNLFVVKQALFVVLGVVAMAVAMRVNYTFFRNPRVVYTGLAVTLLALLLVLVIGREVNGSRRWFALGGMGIQPSELAKVAMILFTAYILERRMDRIAEVRYSLLPIGAALAGVLLLIIPEPDFGSSMVILGIVAVMVFAAGVPYRYLAWIGGALVPAVVILAISSPYRLRRLTAFWHPEDDPLRAGFQVIQSRIAVGTGGLTGLGIGGGVQKRFYLPEPHTDFIYSVISEETGLVGATIILLCFAIIIWRGLRTSLRAPDRFGALTALGLTMMLGAQAFVNISVVLGLLPTKGIPLPLVSAGGSSMIVSLAAMGMLLNISQHESTEGWE
jgi:cell division protein FtsW